MKIVVKPVNKKLISLEHDFLVYLMTDDDVSEQCELATIESLNEVISDLMKITGEDLPVFHKLCDREESEIVKETPLILVFYLNKDMMREANIMNEFAESVNALIIEKNANIMAFFLPTDDKERIECINPLLATPDEKDRIGILISEIEKKFDVGQGADDYDNYDGVNMINTSDED